MKKTISLEAKIIGIEEATEKVEKYMKLVKEAKTLAEELANTEFEIEVKELLQVEGNNKEQQLKLDSLSYSDLNFSISPKDIPSMLEIRNANSGM
ncbi:hypothetical protein [Enterococcus gallinarum]|uniref:hypothetical protein n=1 Tax=Enterococcus TaxID=1350 RepID=UPI001C60B1BE|nr:hypothetical protein [Enterococcus gallinarum]UJA22061.1 hypothetical protein HED61_07395 [Enterococcus gallinarum]